MNWTRNDLLSFPTEPLTDLGQLKGGAVIRQGHTIVFIEEDGVMVHITGGFWGRGTVLNPIPNWVPVTRFSILVRGGWVKVIPGSVYDPNQQPYDEDDI